MTGLYIHIPYCLQKCRYCDFLSAAAPVQPAYSSALLAELRMFARCEIDTVFIGGGTPSVLCTRDLERLFQSIAQHFTFAKKPEITIECNPATFDLEKARVLRSFANRVSLGVQSLEDDVLRTVGRAHNAEQALRAVDILRTAGFENLNVDLMYGLPGQTICAHERTMKTILPLVDHASIYSLILEENTPLYADVQQGKVALPEEETLLEMFDATNAYTAQMGLIRYEVSNFAKAEKRCCHNVNYWEYGSYLAAGAGAVGQQVLPTQTVRVANIENVAQYIHAVQMNVRPIANTEEIGETEALFEHYMMGLRQTQGAVYRSGAWDDYFEKGIKKGVFQRHANRIGLTPDWFDLANGILCEMMQVGEKHSSATLE